MLASANLQVTQPLAAYVLASQQTLAVSALAPGGLRGRCPWCISKYLRRWRALQVNCQL